MTASGLCRDCLSQARGEARRCAACGSPRLARHHELHGLAIAHIDCDAFFAAVEKRDDPTLVDKPVIIGGGRRGVVATACYVARTYGVRSAMPMFKALQACPDAVVIRPNMGKYKEAGRAVRRLMEELTPLVEPVSIDEAFLDLTGTERLHGASPAASLMRLARRVEAELGITVSVGLSYNKFLAKVASDLDKPRGFSSIGRAEARAFLAEKPVGIIPGVGAAAAARLAEAGVTLIRHLAEAPPEVLFRALGRDANRLAQLAKGEDDGRVTPDREVKSVSAETTFEADIAAFDELRPILWRLSERVSGRMKQGGVAGRTVTLKLKDARHRLRTRSVTLPAPTRLAGRIFEAAERLLKVECDGAAFRLIGVGCSDLCDPALADRGDLADPGVRRDAAREAAVDRLRERFGTEAVVRGLAFGKG